GDETGAVQRVPAVGGTGAQAQRTELGAGVDTEVEIAAGQRGGARRRVHRSLRVAGGDAESRAVAQRAIGTNEETAAGVPGRSGVAVAVVMAPGTHELAPPGEPAPAVLHRRTAGAFAGLAQAAGDGVAQIAAVFQQHALRGGVDLAGELV